MWQKTADLITFTEEILNRKTDFLVQWNKASTCVQPKAMFKIYMLRSSWLNQFYLQPQVVGKKVLLNRIEHEHTYIVTQTLLLKVVFRF